MDITFTTRHGNPVSEQIRSRATRRLGRLERYSRRITAATVAFDSERGSRLVEVRLSVAGRPPLVARADSGNSREAFDRAVARLERQLKRWQERRVARRTARVREAGAPEEID